MKIVDSLKRFFRNAGDGGVSLSDVHDFFFRNGGQSGEGADLSEITYFTCLKTLGESIGKMPVYLMDSDKNRIVEHETTRVLGIQPNSIMTPLQFFTTLEYHRNHYGNAYVMIERDRVRATLKNLHILNPQCVQVWVNNTDSYMERRYFYRYTDSRTGKEYWIAPDDMIHLRAWITDDTGLVGKSVRQILAENMAGNKATQRFLNDLYRKGLTANAVVKYVGDLKKPAQDEMLRRIDAQARDNSRRLITLPVGADIQTLDLKLTDSQFYELKRYSALQVAAAFGVNPDHLNDYTKSSYNNSAMQNLQFYVNTLLYNVSLYEQEMNRKLLTEREQKEGKGFKFNVWVILRGDPSQQADILQKMVQSAIYSPNEARAKLDSPPCDGGDVHMVNGSYVRLEDIGKAYAGRGGENE
ncbi:phage portal protein [uncultured Selenomonas sp.]|uniref:phage portal protein n=1 Tax=uncultured Selenomonas sp. TaxID=159275 RepID=UPI0028D3F853|nr:phage portal protein [uncultured Selenomonas sp.]